MQLNMRASAVLVWLPEGEMADSFDVGQAEPPPTPNPEAYWRLF